MAAPTAHADPVAVACVGSGTATYNPGIKNSQQTGTVSFTESLSCTQTLPLPIGQYNGTASETLSAVYSCTSLLGGRDTTATRVISWAGISQTSTFTYTSDVQRTASQTVITETGLITAGRYNGAAATHVIVFANPAIEDCGTLSGVTSLTGATQFTIAEA
ncbi:hypothetical protein ACFWVB_37580 [Streptomyces microflavus]|uniref:hypothetical protein n=1 Tax=Streptomyces TaxID=1883 RepID=UPI00364A4EEA